jgi:hypothetical protein
MSGKHQQIKYSSAIRICSASQKPRLGSIRREGLEMPDSGFKIVTDGDDWGSPLASEAALDSLAEAQAAAREYLTSQRQAVRFGNAASGRHRGNPGGRAVVKHSVG